MEALIKKLINILNYSQLIQCFNKPNVKPYVIEYFKKLDDDFEWECISCQELSEDFIREVSNKINFTKLQKNKKISKKIKNKIFRKYVLMDEEINDVYCPIYMN
jgi:hypothetical protein